MITALILYSKFHQPTTTGFERERALRRLARIMEPWDVWVGLLSGSSRFCNYRTTLLFPMRFLSIWGLPLCEKCPSDLWGMPYRLTCVGETANNSDSADVLFSVDIQSSIALASLRRLPLEQKQVDILIDAVRQSPKLDEDQEDRMIEGIRAFKIRGPKI